MPTKWYESKLVSSKEIAPQTRLFTLNIQDENNFSFQPGQFITFDLPIHEKRLHRWKSYSIANAPNETNLFELCIVKNEGGLGTQYLFDDINTGDILKFKGPEGNFILPVDIPETLYFICTGTGIAPFRSMLWEFSKNPEKAPAIKLLFGTRKIENVLFLKEWLEILKLLPDFQIHIALSREEELPSFDHEHVYFYKGYVHQIYQNMHLTDINKGIFYICGWQNMVDEAQKNLQNLGLPPAHIHTELYG
jgi:ferredoxin-NADP reductase